MNASPGPETKENKVKNFTQLYTSYNDNKELLTFIMFLSPSDGNVSWIANFL